MQRSNPDLASSDQSPAAGLLVCRTSLAVDLERTPHIATGYAAISPVGRPVSDDTRGQEAACGDDGRRRSLGAIVLRICWHCVYLPGFSQSSKPP